MHSIRYRITVITVAAILTMIIAVFAASYSTLDAENDRRSVEILNLLAQDTSKSLEQHFESIEQSVEMAAYLAYDSLDSVLLVEAGAAGRHAAESEPSPEQRSRFDDYLSGYCGQIREAFGSVASHTHGVVTYYYCINPAISVQEHGFFYSRVGKTGFAEQEPLDARTLDPADIEHTTWYYTPIERGRPSWVGPYTAHFLGEMWISSYLVPIYKAGALIGVLGMDIPVETLVAHVSPIRVFQTGFAALLDEQGRVLYYPQQEIGSRPEDLASSVLDELLDRDSNGDKLIRYEKGGEEWQMAFSTLSGGIKLLITAPTREINASWTRLVQILLLITAAIIVVFSLLLLGAMQLITRPLQRLTDASRQLAAADYDVALDYSSEDEVGVLTDAFKQMRDKIRLYITDLNRRVYTDPLTGLPNMRRFYETAGDECRSLQEAGRHPVLLYFNLIGMKYFNRQYRLETGDRLLCEVGAILSRYYSERRLCRLSDDHFAAVSDEESFEAELAAIFADCRRCESVNVPPVRVGVYPYRLEDVDVSIACDRAKYACDRHRGSYLSGWCAFDAPMLRQIENVRYIINHLDRALEERWIEVWFQPIIRAASGLVCDEEALSRWIDPERGLLSPAEFVPILERARLIYKLDLYVLDRVLEKMRAQQQAGLPLVPHSLNLSRADFDSCDIVEEIRRRVDAAGIARSQISIEVTESMVGSDFTFMKSQVQRFQALGFPVWMDDFGSGYSSLDALQDLHFDLLKFDMRFMQRFDEGRESRIILTELVRMAQNLEIDTVCEGVETAAEADFLREIGCTKLQGFHFCKPIPYAEIVERSRTGQALAYELPGESA